MSENLRIGVIMGSDSDLGTMRHVGRALNELGLAFGEDYEERVISAHRTPRRMMDYAQTAKGRGLRIIIAGAGGSAHLPGMVASETVLPVLAVVITKSPDVMNRALGSMIGMPEGKPLAVFQAEAGAFNAGLFAARLLMHEDKELYARYLSYGNSLAEAVERKDNELALLGAEQYLETLPPKA